MEEVEESERTKLVKSPDTPTQAEVDEHESTGHGTRSGAETPDENQ